jgi:DNA-binding NarL/FixJ family response regulator
MYRSGLAGNVMESSYRQGDPEQESNLQVCPSSVSNHDRKELHVKNKIVYISLYAAPDAELLRLLEGEKCVVSVQTVDGLTGAGTACRDCADMAIIDTWDPIRENDEVLWKIRKALPDIPMILIASQISVESYLRLMALGMHEYLCRPITHREILRTVGIVLDSFGPSELAVGYKEGTGASRLSHTDNGDRDAEVA